MFLDDEEASNRIRTRGTFSFVWIALTALIAFLATMFGLLGDAYSETLATHPSAVAHQTRLAADLLSHRDVTFGLLLLVFVGMAVGLYSLVRRSMKDTLKAEARRFQWRG